MPTITRLVTIDRVKSRLGTTESGEDAALYELIEAATELACRLVGSEIRREADVTLYPACFPRDTRRLPLSRFPIESISSVKQAYSVPDSNDWSEVTALTEFTDWMVDESASGSSGRNRWLVRLNDDWLAHPRFIQVVGTFGFADPASVPSGAHEPPEDLQEALAAEVIQRWTYRNTGGVGEVSLPSGGSYRSRGLKPHTALVDACRRLRAEEAI